MGEVLSHERLTLNTYMVGTAIKRARSGPLKAARDSYLSFDASQSDPCSAVFPVNCTKYQLLVHGSLPV